MLGRCAPGLQPGTRAVLRFRAEPGDETPVPYKQLAGIKKRSSEALLHLEIYRQRADVKSVVHCHPPHATAFAIAREPIPQCVLPEVEVFLGETPITGLFAGPFHAYMLGSRRVYAVAQKRTA